MFLSFEFGGLSNVWLHWLTSNPFIKFFHNLYHQIHLFTGWLNMNYLVLTPVFCWCCFFCLRVSSFSNQTKPKPPPPPQSYFFKPHMQLSKTCFWRIFLDKTCLMMLMGKCKSFQSYSIKPNFILKNSIKPHFILKNLN